MNIEFTREYWIRLFSEFTSVDKNKLNNWCDSGDTIMRERSKNIDFDNPTEYQTYYSSKELFCSYIRWHFELGRDKRKKIVDLMKPDSYILDFGCGIASQTYISVIDKDCKADLYDISELIRGFNYYIIYKHQLEDKIKIITEIDKDKRYDYILLLDVLEHLREPERTLDWLSLFLKESGKVIARAPFNLKEDKSHLESNYDKNLEEMLIKYIGKDKYILVEI